eukprot:499420-Prymnesium_polylepis.1
MSGTVQRGTVRLVSLQVEWVSSSVFKSPRSLGSERFNNTPRSTWRLGVCVCHAPNLGSVRVCHAPNLSGGGFFFFTGAQWNDIPPDRARVSDTSCV